MPASSGSLAVRESAAFQAAVSPSGPWPRSGTRTFRLAPFKIRHGMIPAARVPGLRPLGLLTDRCHVVTDVIFQRTTTTGRRHRF